MSSNKSAAYIMWGALALGVLADLLFYRRYLGISFLVFILLCIGALLWAARLEGVRPVRQNLWLMAALAFFAAMVGIRAGPFLTFLNLGTSFLLAGFIAYFFAAHRVHALDILEYPIAWLLSAGGTLARPIRLIAEGLDPAALRQRNSPHVAPVLRGVLLAIPLLFAFATLFAASDIVFASYLEDLLTLFDLVDLTWQLLLIIGVAWVWAGGTAYALARGIPLEDTDKPRSLIPLESPYKIGFIEVATALVMVNALFLSFVLIQFTYFFGGRANIRVEGFTYSEYARRGFFELLFASALTLGLIWALDRLTRRETPRQVKIFKILSTAMVGMTLVILVSAFQRLLLYEEAYGYTHLRLYSHLFMVWLAALLVLFAATLWLDRRRIFSFGALLAIFGFMATLNWINPDRFIAQQNLARYQMTGDLDVFYLRGLSEDAVPVLLEALPTLAPEERLDIACDLAYRLDTLSRCERCLSGPSIHWAGLEAYAWLNAYRERLAEFPRCYPR